MCGIVVGIALMIAGLSGEYVLKGTNSSLGLAVLGFLVLLYGIYSVRRRSSL